MAAADGPVLTVTKVSRISVDVDNQPLNALLRVMAEKGLVNIRGGAAGNESLTLHLANLTLPEMLSKILRGYNYAVVKQGKNRPPVLTVMGRIRLDAAAAHGDTSARGDTPAPAATPPEPRSYIPPEPPPESAVPPRQPVAQQPQTPQNGQPVGEAARQTGQIAPLVQPGQTAGLTGVGATNQFNGQPGGEGQKEALQEAPGGQPARQAEAPPAESPGIHF
jgi:hypothetical protein